MASEKCFWNITVPKKVLESKYPDGPEQFKLDCPNKMYQEDESIASYSFMDELGPINVSIRPGTYCQS